jgi:hypothetical protein
MSSWRGPDEPHPPRGRRDFRGDAGPPRPYYPPPRDDRRRDFDRDDWRGRSRSRERGRPYDGGPPRPFDARTMGRPPPGYDGRGRDGPPRGYQGGRDAFPRRRADQPVRKGRIGPRPSRKCIALNRELTNPQTDVLRLFAERGAEFNGVNLSTAIYQLAKRRADGQDPRCGQILDRAAARIEAEGGEFDARALANCAWGAVKIGAAAWPRVLDAVARAAPNVLHDFNPQAIANTRVSPRLRVLVRRPSLDSV